MLPTVLVLVAALLHAAWNTLIKFSAERLLVVACMDTVALLFVALAQRMEEFSPRVPKALDVLCVHDAVEHPARALVLGVVQQAQHRLADRLEGLCRRAGAGSAAEHVEQAVAQGVAKGVHG